MFYYLFYNSSFTFIVENRLFSTILYGSILYIITHAILTYCGIEVLDIIKNYYWSVLALDVLSLSYCLYTYYWVGKASDSQSLNVSFNMLKNKINSIVNSDNIANQGIRILNTSATPKQSQSSQQQNSLQQNSSQGNTTNQQRKLPIKTSGKSTPISLLRGNMSGNMPSIIPDDINVQDPIMEESQSNSEGFYGDFGESGNVGDSSELGNRCDTGDANTRADRFDSVESVAGSDIGSLMDLDEFEKTL
jgi:hypothetical protein